MRFLGLVIVVLGVSWTRVECQACSRALSVPLTNASRMENGSVIFDGRIFPQETVWSDGEVTFGCPCEAFPPCIRTCCSPGEWMNGSTCIRPTNETVNPVRPLDKYLVPEIRSMNELSDVFYTIPNIICPSEDKYALDPEEFPDQDMYTLHADGVMTTADSQVLSPDKYCIGLTMEDQSILVAVCHNSAPIKPPKVGWPIGMIVSIPFLVVTGAIYAILPELRNIYGKTLMCYVACLTIAYAFLTVVQLAPTDDMELWLCQTLAFVIHFSFLASFFWLNVMCVDIWWTFAGYRSIQGSVRQRERKKFILYSIYAWGCACLLTGICIIMEYAPGIPSNVVRPEFGVEKCWFKTEMAKAYYFYIPMGLTVLCNIILFILTAAKIIQHKKNTAHQLKGTESRRHDDNKQWFNLYLKLFIVMGINWSMEIISWAYKSPEYLWYITDLANTLQGVIIFIIFVWKEKIKRLLIKRFGCKGENFLSRDSTRSAYHSSTSRTCTTSVPLNEKTNSCPEPAAKYKSTNFDDSDGA
ncbi:G-protein coupled receptor Mth isoform X3 [Neodiprion lecontei]|uniref:G-protein coupled receptor Mth isoform X3 n=1 Tax=Neodiprion lecontei TaxID=441921 RepID=A0A6J0BHN0_NEOLC|nr:G-protein coupled receptor Mth isoform X3 [Neodiprion lecontei]